MERARGEALQIACLRTGVVRPKRLERGVRRYLPGGWSSTTLPVNAFAVLHPSGLCMFDVGQTARAGEPGYLPRWHPFLRLAKFELTTGEEAPALLLARGWRAEDVRWVVLSHLHTDHVGTVAMFPNAEIIVSAVEWSRAQGWRGSLRGYLPRRWPAQARVRQVDLPVRPWGPFSRSLDLTGDGALTLLPAPGHTPGHLAMAVRSGGRTYLLAGDAAHLPAQLREGDGPVAQLARERAVTVLTAHDPEAERLLADLAGTPVPRSPHERPGE